MLIGENLKNFHQTPFIYLFIQKYMENVKNLESTLETSRNLSQALKTAGVLTKNPNEMQTGELQTLNSLTQTDIDKAVQVLEKAGSTHSNTIARLSSLNLDAKKSEIPSEVRQALADVASASKGVTAENYNKMVQAQKTIDTFTKKGRLDAEAARTRELQATLVGTKKTLAPAEGTPKTLSRDQVNTQARRAELEAASAKAPVHSNTPADLARMAEYDAATKDERLARSAEETRKLQEELVPKAKKTVAPTESAPKTLSRDQANTQARLEKLREDNKLYQDKMDVISTMNLEELTNKNDAQYKEAVTKLTNDKSVAVDSKEQARIENILGQYGSAVNVRNESKKYAKTDAQKLESEKTFARALMNLEAQK